MGALVQLDSPHPLEGGVGWAEWAPLERETNTNFRPLGKGGLLPCFLAQKHQMYFGEIDPPSESCSSRGGGVEGAC